MRSPTPCALRLARVNRRARVDGDRSLRLDDSTLRRTRAVAFHAPSSNRAAESDTPSKSLDTSTLCPQPARANAQLDSEFSADATTVQKRGQEPCEANSNRAPSAQTPSTSSRGRSGAHVRRVDWERRERQLSRLAFNATSSTRHTCCPQAILHRTLTRVVAAPCLPVERRANFEQSKHRVAQEKGVLPVAQNLEKGEPLLSQNRWRRPS